MSALSATSYAYELSKTRHPPYPLQNFEPKNDMISRQFILANLVAVISLLVAERSQADPILSITFDDPNGLFTRYTDGISISEFQTTPEIRETKVATGIGGNAFLHIDTTEWVEGSVDDPPKSFELISDSAMGTKAFLRLNDDKQVRGTRGLAVITPDGIERSLSSLSQVKDGKAIINGGVDMFFRYNEENPSQQEFDAKLLSTAGDGLRLTVESNAGSIVATLTDDKDAALFDTDLDGVADATKARTEPTNMAPIDPETAYHLAITLETADTGVVTMKVFLKQGNDAINTKEDVDLVSQASFSVITEDGDKTLQKRTISIGADSGSSPAKAILDLAAFRIFKPAPAVFPDSSGGQ